MARCPFAKFEEITGPVGAFSGGPFKIIHHTTEGSTYAGAKAAYRSARSDPHFTVAGDEVFQHIDTGVAARALRNAPGGVATNRHSAIQIEVVGFAGRPKDVTTLNTVARLCRWIESEHGVSEHWPNGRPRVSTNGRDPGGHNRTASVWHTEGGHYGHSQVPENTHWDPGYSAAELAIVTPAAVFDAHGELAAGAESVEAAPELETVRPSTEAEAIVQRVLSELASTAPSIVFGSVSRVTVRVAAGGVEVRVSIEGERRDSTGTASKPKRPGTRARRSRARPRRR